MMLIRVALVGLLLAPVAGWGFYRPMRVLAPELNRVSCVSDEISLRETYTRPKTRQDAACVVPARFFTVT